MKPLIIYHKCCMDGAGAALVAWLKFGDEAEYRSASYGDPPPTCDEVRGGREVYILDFCYPRDVLISMWNNVMDIRDSHGGGPVPGPYAGKFVVLDHHKTAQATLADLPFCTFDMSKSGVVMAWDHFHQKSAWGKSVPELLAYIQDRDLWRWGLPHSREISAALAASGAFEDFHKLIPIYRAGDSCWKDQLVHEGAAILRAQEQQVALAVATAEEVHLCWRETEGTPPWTFKGDPRCVRALAVSCPLLQSEIGDALALESVRRGRDAVGVVYYKHGPSGMWRVSLRSRDTTAVIEDLPLKARLDDTPDVSVIAKCYNGGGHHRAAGFECDRLPWYEAPFSCQCS